MTEMTMTSVKTASNMHSRVYICNSLVCLLIFNHLERYALYITCSFENSQVTQV